MSSVTTKRRSKSSFSASSQCRTALPLRFMKVDGLSRTSWRPRCLHRATSPNRSALKEAPLASAKASSAMKPMLWRVRAYSAPGLPRPTNRYFMDQRGLFLSCSGPRHLLFLQLRHLLQQRRTWRHACASRRERRLSRSGHGAPFDGDVRHDGVNLRFRAG